MKVAEVRIRPYEVPFVAPFRTAHGTWHHRRGFLVWVRDGDDVWGVGEAAPLAGLAMEPPEETARVLEEWARRLRGATFRFSEPPDDEEPQWAFLDSARHAPAAQHGMELALVDLLARRAGQPLATYLEPRAAQAVAVNAVVGGESLRESVERAQALVAAGFVTLKVKMGLEAPADDVERMRQIRRAVGPHVRLRADANGAWDEAAALEVLERLAPLQVEYVEQPVAPHDLDAMARVAARSPVPVAADEAVQSAEDARRVLEAGAARVLVLKPMALGGPLTALTVTRLAARLEVPVVITTTLDAVVARLGALHVAAAVQALLPEHLPHYACGLATGSLLAGDVAPDPSPPRGGRMQVPPAAGIGTLPAPPTDTTAAAP